MTENSEHLQAPIADFVRKDITRLRQDLTVQQALDLIRRQGLGEQIVYFYVVDAEERLIGVVPTRRLLTAGLEERLADILGAGMIGRSEGRRLGREGRG